MAHNAKTVWRDGMTFDAISDDKTDLKLTMSSSALSQEEGQNGLSPMGLVLVGLAGCTAMDVVSILKKKRQELTLFEVEVDGEQADEHPKVYKKIKILYRVGGPNIDKAAVERAIELSVTKYCSVNGMLEQTAEITHEYEIVND